MSSYREKHYYTSQIPATKPCCGCDGNSSQTIANIEAQLDAIAEMLSPTVEIKSLGGKSLATVFVKE